MSRQIIVLGLLAAGLSLTGCHSCCKQRGCTSARPSCYGCTDSPQPPPALKPAQPPWRQPSAVPPIASIGGPQQATYLEPRDGSTAPKPLPNGGEAAPTPPAPEEQFPEAGPPVKLLPPRRVGDNRQDDNFDDPRAEVPGPGTREERDGKTAPKDDEIRGILNVKRVSAGVSSGFTPYEVDHYRWLKDKNFRTVLHLRAPGKSNEAIKDGLVSNGIAYERLDVSVNRLTIAAYEKFVKQVDDTRGHPLYVCDADGRLAGALWYLYFRHHKNDSDTNARAEAKLLGLDFTNPDNKEIVLATQALLNLLENPRD